MIEYLFKYLFIIWGLILEMAPYLLFGFFISGVLKVYLSKNIVKHFKGNSFKSIFSATLFGVPLPLCSCGVIPAGVSLRKSGASKSSTLSFLISTPQTGVDSIMVTYAMMGWQFAVVRPVFAFVSGIIGGLMGRSIVKDDLTVETNENIKEKVVKKGIIPVLKYAYITLFEDISRHLLIGILLAGLISLFIPEDFTSLIHSYPGMEYLVILLISLPLYVCATGSIPIAAVLIAKGISPGAAFIFLMAGPATNIATMNVIANVMGQRALIAYLVSIVSTALLFGLIINNGLTLSIDIYHSHEGLGYSLIFGLLISLLIVYHTFKGMFKKKEITEEAIIYAVDGMVCNGCKANIEKNVLLLDGVVEVLAEPQSNEVEIKGKVDEALLSSTINALGFRFKGKLPQ